MYVHVETKPFRVCEPSRTTTIVELKKTIIDIEVGIQNLFINCCPWGGPRRCLGRTIHWVRTKMISKRRLWRRGDRTLKPTKAG